MSGAISIARGPSGEAADVTITSIAAGTNIIGQTLDAGDGRTCTVTYTNSGNLTTAGAVTPAPTGGEKLIIIDIVVAVAAAMFILFEIETAGTDLMVVYFAAAGTYQITPRGKWKLATADKKLFADASISGEVNFTVITASEA